MGNVKRLPDSYAKNADSNNAKLLNLNERAIADVKADAQALLDILDLDNATGRTLELYGDMVGQKRGVLNDEQYLIMIRTRMAMNVAQGNYATIIGCAKNIFKCEASDIILRDAEEPCVVWVDKFPLHVLVNAGFSSKQAVQILDMILPVGVVINDANFEGTFEFAETAGEYDEKAGFADLDQTIGGYLGLLYGEDDNAPVLPL